MCQQAFKVSVWDHNEIIYYYIQHLSDLLFCHQFLYKYDENRSEVDLQCINEVQVQTDNAEYFEVTNALSLLHLYCSANDLDVY